MVDEREHGAVSAKKANTTIGGANDAGTETETESWGGVSRERRDENDKTTRRRARGAERQREGNNRGDTTRVPAIWGKQQQADGAHAFLLRKTREREREGGERERTNETDQPTGGRQREQGGARRSVCSLRQDRIEATAIATATATATATGC